MLDKKYNVIYADPPWSYNQFQGKGKKYGDVSAHYTTMSLEELRKLPIKEITDRNCVIFMWATFPNLKEALELIECWGFKYKTVGFVWVKTRSTGQPYSGIGFYTNSNAEICLIGTKGSLPRNRKDIKQIIMSPLQEHSRKPLEAYRRIELLYGEVSRIELFARHRRVGWDTWGNQVPKETQHTILDTSIPPAPKERP